MDAMQVLVIILSVFLALFLGLAIALTILLIRVTRKIQKIADTTESAVTKFNKFATTAAQFVSPAFIVKIIANQFKKRKDKS